MVYTITHFVTSPPIAFGVGWLQAHQCSQLGQSKEFSWGIMITNYVSLLNPLIAYWML